MGAGEDVGEGEDDLGDCDLAADKGAESGESEDEEAAGALHGLSFVVDVEVSGFKLLHTR